MTKISDNDAYGKGLLSYQRGNHKAKFTVYSDIAETEKWNISTFFRDYDEMPEIEKKALSLCQGKILDIGAGAGSHALALQKHNYSVTAIDISKGAVEVMKSRGIEDARLQDFFRMVDEKFDTLLMMMNGIGIVGKTENLDHFFCHAKHLMNKKGRIILDSSNLIYLYLEEDGSALIDLNSKYYGELRYRMDFGNFRGEWFDWLFIDYDLLSESASKHGFECRKIYEDDHYLYLAELTLHD